MQTTTTHIAKNIRDIHFGGNWTYSNLKDQVADVDWLLATKKLHSFNTIATLVFHVNYFVEAAITVLEGKSLTAKDQYSFNHPPIHSEEDWQKMLDKTWADAERFAALVEQMPHEKLWEDFWDKKYGSYYRNFHGIIEHMHYHLGQIVILKKMLLMELK